MGRKWIVGGIVAVLLVSSVIPFSADDGKVNIGMKKRMTENVERGEGKPVENFPVSISSEKTWMKTFNKRILDSGYCVEQTSDGGYIVAGFTGPREPHGNTNGNAWLIKSDSDGYKEWDKIFGKSTGEDIGFSVQQTKDGGYVIAGYTMSYAVGKADAWLIKIDAHGNEEWNKTFGGKEWDSGYSIQQTNDGGYIIVGTTSSHGKGSFDVWLIKTDENGNEMWNETFGGENPDIGVFVQQTSDKEYIIAGYTSSYGAGDSDVWLIKTDSGGNEEWNRTFGGGSTDVGCCVREIEEGYIIGGYTDSFGAGKTDVWLIKIDEKGNEIWNKTFGGKNLDGGQSIQQTADGGYIIAGFTWSYCLLICDAWLIKTDENGNMEWNKAFGRKFWTYDTIVSVQQTNDNGYILTGSTWTKTGADVWLIKTDENGNVRNKMLSKNAIMDIFITLFR